MNSPDCNDGARESIAADSTAKADTEATHTPSQTLGATTPSVIRRTRPTLRFMLSHPAHMASIGLGSGLSPIMPGTCGTLAGWLIFAILNPYLSTAAWIALIVIGFIGGVWLCGFTAKKMQTPDPGAVVWDEIVAIWIVLLLVTPSGFWEQFLCFVVFRFFDMVKPPPIRFFDQRLKGGFGIMFDDLVAAFFSLIVIALIGAIVPSTSIVIRH